MNLRLPSTIGSESARELGDALERANADASSEPIVLEPAGAGIFCRGMDFAEIAQRGEPGEIDQATADGVRLYARCLRLIRTSTRPVIAVVDGEVLAGGVGIAAASDVVIGTERTTFALSEVLFGLIPAMVLPFLIERMPAQKARWMALGGTAVHGARAEELGLVDVFTTTAELDKTVRRQCKSLARCAPRGVARLKSFTAGLGGLDVLAALELGATETTAALRDDSVLEAVRRFVRDGVMPWQHT